MLRATIFFILAFHLCAIETYRILGIFPLPGKSHMRFWYPIMEELATKGHEVDVYSFFPKEKPIPRYNELNTLQMKADYSQGFTIDYLKDNFNNVIQTGIFVVTNAGLTRCTELFNSTTGIELKNTEKKYDLLITHILGSDCMLGFAHHFKIPVIGLVSSVNLPWMNDRIGNPDNPSYIPNYLSPYSSSMTFIERLSNTIVLLGAKLGYNFISGTRNTEVAREFFGKDLPDLRDLAYNTSLILVNSHFSINQARPMVPNFIEVGGLHIKPPKPLSAKWEEHLQLHSKYKGVIYFSTGSMIMSETFPEHKLLAFFEAFSEIPYKVLWKADIGGIPKSLVVPSNIHFEKWFPQVDILCHPNLKLLVTHGGMLSTQEASYCGVPRLGIPFNVDQGTNLKSAVDLGIAIIVKFDQITKESISDAVKSLLEEPRYGENALKVSQIFKDRPLSPLNTAIYWIEYVIRHKGAPHLRSEGANLPWYQYYLVDVGLFLFAFTAMFIIATYYLFVAFSRMLLCCKPIVKSKTN